MDLSIKKPDSLLSGLEVVISVQLAATAKEAEKSDSAQKSR